ncbi:3-oxoacyl-[acyl-carrier protein] reductase [Actinoalloteichus hoggarensis]|uniref:3-oxoacyl-[acyl-carrier-protein] reductase FabG n=1 Tax=Actinoalloteichus hoggarensis TaxID=1470176 RepID=A0A221W8T3_9PSEU|nr:SDR family oxidoreductase [Actinoalloteichus hoggarensis]ASO22315.1 3-oxoacyl-[acyl-carrier-protein] reductase FabG [Actinoalloteichus hoggarensis]MBB5923265.1 3-oxoacyl-[acyl-carrier protein] reductase [Actinoalloteichus hoggarensis]
MRRTAVVTGGGTGIGRAAARELTDAGFEVVVIGRRPEPLAAVVAELGPTVTPLSLDVADPAALAESAPRLPACVDVLVNNAGGNTDIGQPAPAEGDLVALRDSWQANLNANLLSAVLVTELLRPRLAENGRVINLGSIASRYGAAGYGAAKAAVETWTKELAFGLGGRGITANVVAPGYTEDTEFFRGRMTDARRTTLLEKTATKRVGLAADIAAVIGFLASPRSGHVTGQVLHVNGGAYLGG